MTRLLVATLALACSLVGVCGHIQHTNNLRHTSKQDPPAPADWNYKMQGGDWMAEGDCALTDRQSPIDIDEAKTDVSNDALSIMWAIPRRLPLTNNGKTLTLTLPAGGASGLVFRGHPYRLAHCVFHGPSEHTFEGDSRDLEVQFVHQSIEDPTKFAVVALTYSDDHSEPIALSDPFLRSIINAEIPAVGGAATEVKMPSDTHGLLDWQGEFFHYLGSLTSPPCTENVSWFVQKRPVAAPLEELQKVQELFRFKGTRGNWRKTVNKQNIQKVSRVTLLESLDYLVNKGHATKPSGEPQVAVEAVAEQPTVPPTQAPPKVHRVEGDLAAAAAAAAAGTEERAHETALVKHHTAHAHAHTETAHHEPVRHERVREEEHVREQRETREHVHAQVHEKRHHVVREEEEEEE